MKLPFTIMCFALLIGCNESSAPSKSTNDSWSHENVLMFDGLSRTYSVYVPQNGELQGLVLVLHGSGQTVADHILEIEVEAAADANGLIIAVPAAIHNGWNDEDPPDGDELADDVGFIDALATELKAMYPSIPTNKIFAHGFSNGGGLATRLACESSQIRGVGVIGNDYASLSGNCQRPLGHPIPGWFGAGTEDELVSIEAVQDSMSDYAGDLTDCNGTGELTTVEVPDLPSNVECKQFTDCDAVQLCEYTDREHEVLPESIAKAWYFLSEAVESSTD